MNKLSLVLLVPVSFLFVETVFSIVVTYWLYRIWKVKRNSGFLWLALGIAVIPLFFRIAMSAIAYLPLLRVLPNDQIVFTISIFLARHVYPIVRCLCIAVALHKMYGGAVKFGDLFHPRRCLAGGTTDLGAEEGV